MRILGLDPGNRYACVTHGTISPPARLDLAGRLLAIVERVDEVLVATAPDGVVVEQAFYHESVRSTLVLGHVRGALLVAAARRGVAIAEYSPREIKMSVVGRGSASKEQVSFMVRRMLALDGAVAEDASDALAAAVCHLQRARWSPSARPAGAAARRLDALLASRR
jgi:crossover junction endodeoxyribonuclease RuvC